MNPENWIGASEAAVLLSISKVTFWSRRKQGRYPDPVLMIGNRPVFDKDAILAAKERGRAS